MRMLITIMAALLTLLPQALGGAGGSPDALKIPYLLIAQGHLLTASELSTLSPLGQDIVYEYLHVDQWLSNLDKLGHVSGKNMFDVMEDAEAIISYSSNRLTVACSSHEDCDNSPDIIENWCYINTSYFDIIYHKSCEHPGLVTSFCSHNQGWAYMEQPCLNGCQDGLCKK